MNDFDDFDAMTDETWGEYDAMMDFWDDEPNPYLGTYSEM